MMGEELLDKLFNYEFILYASMYLNRVPRRLSTSLVLGRCIDMEDIKYDFVQQRVLYIIRYRIYYQFTMHAVEHVPCTI
uniref:Uncharacterized protein n=1 Tax=Physcomitrium patens TaxID=3218 RepID=A0A2K1JGU7_PHYPA|nr:hypothetical protein PHYPA_018188 [Physcomitrium patens]